MKVSFPLGLQVMSARKRTDKKHASASEDQRETFQAKRSNLQPNLEQCFRPDCCVCISTLFCAQLSSGFLQLPLKAVRTFEK